MDRNRTPRGTGWNRLSWKKSVPANHELLGSESFDKGFLPKVEFWVESGVVEIRDARLFRVGQEPFCLALVEEMLRPDRARRAEICLASATCRIEFEPGREARDELASKVAAALRAASIGVGGRLSASTISVGEPESLCEDSMALAITSEAEPRRMVNLALAGGSFALAVAGVVLPGIPALPFLLLTGHYLVRSSPELCRSLAHVPGIGALLQKAEALGGQVIDRRSLWKMFGITVATVTAFLILHPPLPVVILLEVGIIAYYGLREFRKPARTALGMGMA